MPSAETERERLFFALWPEPQVRARLECLVRSEAVARIGKPVAAENLHLTLVFLGACASRERDCMKGAAAQVRVPGFSLCLDRIGYWRRSRILWAGADGEPPELVELVGSLSRHLAQCGYHPESRPYRAHLTLARKAGWPVSVPPMEPVRWRVQTFCLVRSVTTSSGSQYEILHTWPLAPELASRGQEP